MYTPAFNCNYQTIGSGLKFSGVLVTEKKSYFYLEKRFNAITQFFPSQMINKFVAGDSYQAYPLTTRSVPIFK
jgi:hypothetical protein